MYRKGVYQGSKNMNSRLTEGEVRTIRKELGKGTTAGELARVYTVSAETIRRIGRWETWNWLEEVPGEGLPDAAPKIVVDEAEMAASVERMKDLLKGKE